MTELRSVPPGEFPGSFPARLVELLARPRLTELPENPVGRILEQLRSVFHDFSPVDLPEVVDLEAAKGIAAVAMYVDPIELHRVDDTRIPLRLNAPAAAARALRRGSVEALGGRQGVSRCQVDSRTSRRFTRPTRSGSTTVRRSTRGK